MLIFRIIGTALTVGASYFDFNISNSMAGAIFVGLVIASIKGYLVAANFMHLNSEKKMILWILLLTVILLLPLLFIPVMWDINNMGNH